MTRQTHNTPATPTQAQIDAGVARGRRLQSNAFAEFFAAIASLFSTARGTHTQAQH